MENMEKIISACCSSSMYALVISKVKIKMVFRAYENQIFIVGIIFFLGFKTDLIHESPEHKNFAKQTRPSTKVTPGKIVYFLL